MVVIERGRSIPKHLSKGGEASEGGAEEAMPGASSFFHHPPAEAGKYSEDLQPRAYITQDSREFFGDEPAGSQTWQQADPSYGWEIFRDEPASATHKKNTIGTGSGCSGSSGAEAGQDVLRPTADYYHGTWPDCLPFIAEQGFAAASLGAGTDMLQAHFG